MSDPTEAIRLRASDYPDVDEGTSCTQSSFKAGGKALKVGQTLRIESKVPVPNLQAELRGSLLSHRGGEPIQA